MSGLWATLIALGASTAGTIVWLLLGAGAIAYLSTHPPRRRLKRTPAEFGAAFEDIRFPSRDAVSLSGWLIPSRIEKPVGVVILCHGMLANRAEGLRWAKAMWDSGLTLLLFDFRAIGQSDGNRCSAGYYEAEDLRGAVDYLQSRTDTSNLPVGVFGFSMGGAAAILAAADEDRIKAVATHGTYATLDRAVEQRCKRHYGPFAPIVVWFTCAFGEKLRWFPVSPSLVSPLNAVARLTPRPLLLLHGGRDRTVNPIDAHALHEAAGYPKTLYVMPRSGHRRIHRHIRQEATQRVIDFFHEHLPGS